jgi:hypothetical protein
MEELKLLPYKVINCRVFLNDKYLYTETFIKFYNPKSTYTQEELNQLSKYC